MNADAPTTHQDDTGDPSALETAVVPTVDPRAELAALRERAERERTRDALRIDTLRIMLREGSKRTGAATDRAEKLAALLREVQHHAHWGTCSVCGWHKDHGHAPDCRLAAALADGG